MPRAFAGPTQDGGSERSLGQRPTRSGHKRAADGKGSGAGIAAAAKSIAGPKRGSLRSSRGSSNCAAPVVASARDSGPRKRTLCSRNHTRSRSGPRGRSGRACTPHAGRAGLVRVDRTRRLDCLGSAHVLIPLFEHRRAIVVARVITPTRIEVHGNLLRRTRPRRARGWRRTGPPRPPRRRHSSDRCCWRRGRVGLSGDRTRELVERARRRDSSC